MGRKVGRILGRILKNSGSRGGRRWIFGRTRGKNEDVLKKFFGRRGCKVSRDGGNGFQTWLVGVFFCVRGSTYYPKRMSAAAAKVSARRTRGGFGAGMFLDKSL